MVNFAQVAKGGGMLTTLFRFIWRHKYFLFFITFIIANIIIVDINAHKPEKVFTDVGLRLFNPLQQVQTISQEVIQSHGFINPDVSLLRNFRNGFSFLWTLFFGLYTVWLYIKFFRWGFLQLNNSEVFSATLMGTVIYFLIQGIYLASIGESPLLPLLAMGDFIKALPYFIKPIAQLGDKFNNLNKKIM